MKPFEFLTEAEAELSDAAIRYELDQAGVGFRFEAEVRAAVARIADNPGIAPIHPGTPARQYIMIGFPYSVIYQDTPALLRIIAVAHHKRRPGYWKSRLPRTP